MVVLEEGSMLTTGHNQYLQPDYLSPLPTTLDAKKSPLALLAQTCSQIGADSPTKPLISSLDKPSKGSSARSPPAAKLERTRGSPSDGSNNNNNNNNNNHKSSSNLAFKPYETNVVSTKRSSTSDESASRPASKASSVHSASDNSSANNSASGESSESSGGSSGHKKSRSTPQGRKSASPSQQTAVNATSQSPGAGGERRTPGDRDKSSASPRNNSGASPVIRSGMEILSGHAAAAAAAGKEAAANLQNMYKAGSLAAYGASPLCCPPGLAENPAFRPPFAGASPFSHHHAAAAALLGYPGAGSPNANPYLGYARVKTPSGGETLVPVCKDPYCTGCQYSMHNAQMMMAAAAAAAASGNASSPGGACPSGCTQCDHQKYGLMALGSLGPMPPPPSLAGYPSSLGAGSSAAAGSSRPHVCNWIAGESYCGKRFATSEELLQHLRSHTSLANGAADPAALLAAGQHSHPLLSPTAALHRAAAAAAGSYPAPSLSPLGARYHPYGKPPAGPLPASLAASPYSAFNALGPYYSPYAIYGQRIGAAVHP